MKRSIKLAVAAAVALTSTVAFATNGDNLIGVGAKARGMGGVGIGMSHGAESGLANPAMISTVKGTEVSFGGTIFMPDVATDTGAGMSAGFLDSKADLSVIPEVAVAQKVSDSITWGIGMYGTAGMGTDYRDRTTTTGNFNMVTNLQLMQFSLPVAYSNSGVTVAIAPIIQYGALDIQYKTGGGTYGTGVGQDLSMGYTLGGAYETSGVTLGVVYKSAIDMTYDKVLSTAGSGFGLSLTDNLEQPSEYGAGISYKMGQNTFALDYKRVNWASAKGYKTFGWEDQNVYAIGYEYNTGAWAARLGYNRASSPITEQGSANNGHIYNVMNLLGFPAIVETHYTVGGTYGVTKNTSLDIAYVYAPETEETFAATGAGLASTVSTKHSQKAVSAQVNFNF
jgi:long-chain fatty acid transport protein